MKFSFYGCLSLLQLSIITETDGYENYGNFMLKLFATYYNTSMLNSFCRLPRYSPIICLLKPFRVIKNRATVSGASLIKPCSHKNCRPFSGFLQKKNKVKGQSLKTRRQWYQSIPTSFTCSEIEDAKYLLHVCVRT